MPLPHRDNLHTTEQAAAALEVPAGLVRKWRHLGKVMPAGMVRAAVPGGLAPLYRLAELEPLAAAYHEHRRRRHAGHVPPR